MEAGNLLRCRWVAVLLLAGACGDRAETRTETRAAALDISEERDGLWLTDSTGRRERLTALHVVGYAYGELATRQREGEVILYWAAAPVPDPRGRLIAYASNREAVANDTAGQSIWLLDRESGEERALLSVLGRSFRPVGWLDGDVVYIGDEPGVWALDPRIGDARRLAAGTWIASSPDGSALVVAEDVPEDPALSVLTSGRSVRIPRAAEGSVYLPQATFENGSLLLEATADSGYTRARFRFDIADGSLSRIE